MGRSRITSSSEQSPIRNASDAALLFRPDAASTSLQQSSQAMQAVNQHQASQQPAQHQQQAQQQSQAQAQTGGMAR